MEINVLHPLEKEWQLISHGQINLDHQCGFYLLSDKRWKKWQFITGWKTPGLDPAMNESSASLYQDALNNGLKLLPQRIAMRWEYSCQKDVTFKQEYGTTALAKEFANASELKVKNLSASGNRKKIGIRIFSRYWFFGHELDWTESTDWLNKVIDYGTTMWTGSKEELDLERVTKALRKGYIQGFKVIQRIIKETIKLTTNPLMWDELYVSDYGQLHRLSPPKIPHLLLFDRSGVRTVTDVENAKPLHITSVLAQPESGHAVVPEAGDSYVYLPAKKKYIGYLQIRKPGSTDSSKEQLRYLFDSMAADSGMNDFKIITEVVRANQKAALWQLERQTTNSVAKANQATKKSTIDVNANKKVEGAIIARDEIEEGSSIIVRTASVIELERNSRSQLSDDLDGIVKRLYAATCEICPFAAEDIWLSTLPFSWHDLFTIPSPRYSFLMSRECVSLLPTLAPPTLDKKGVEFIATEGWKPVWLDIIKGLQNLLIIATSRGGKSVLLGSIIIKNFFNIIPTYVLDFPRPTDGTSSFSDITNTLEELSGDAFYFNTEDCANNIIEFPDLEGLAGSADRTITTIESHVSSIVALVMGDIEDPEREIYVEALTRQSYAVFIDRADIKERHRRAQRSSIGSADYENVPTLHDYHDFFEDWFTDYLLGKKNRDRDEEKAGNFIISQLKSVLISPLGKTIARPSSFAGDPRLLVFALKNVSKNRESKILIISAYSALLRKALVSPLSCLIVDETPVLWDFPDIVKSIERTATNGLKWGCRVIISGQSTNKIHSSERGKQILETIHTKMVGYVLADAVPTISSQLEIEKERISPYASLTPNESSLCSYWHIKRNQVSIDTAFFPSDFELAVLANNPDEQAARTRVMNHYSDKIKGLNAFSKMYANAKQNGIEMEDLGKVVASVS